MYTLAVRRVKEAMEKGLQSPPQGLLSPPEGLSERIHLWGAPMNPQNAFLSSPSARLARYCA